MTLGGGEAGVKESSTTPFGPAVRLTYALEAAASFCWDENPKSAADIPDICTRVIMLTTLSFWMKSSSPASGGCGGSRGGGGAGGGATPGGAGGSSDGS